MKKILIGLTIGLILGLGISLLAWINPSGSPPTGGGVIQTQNTGLFINTSTYFTSGNVGIGTTAPSQKLTVVGNIGIQAGANAFVGTLDNYALSLRTNNTDRIFITNTGNVGIGTTAPGAKLHVVGYSQFWANPDTYSPVAGFYSNNPEAPYINWYHRGARYLYIQAGTSTNPFAIIGLDNGANLGIIGGNVGIGTTAPEAKLHIRSDTNSPLEVLIRNDNLGSSADARLTISTGWGGATADPILQFAIPGVRDWIIGIDNADGDKFKIARDFTNNFNNTAIAIDILNNVGIGTTNPLQKVHFRNGDTNIVFNIDNSVPDKVAIEAFNDGNTIKRDILLNPWGGNVGIGTTAPGAKLDVRGLVGINGTSGANNWLNFWTLNDADHPAIIYSTTRDLRIGTWSAYNGGTWTERMRITSGGNVGIGTTTPRTKLDVNGSAIFSSNVTIGFPSLRTDFTLAVNGSILAQTGIALNLASADASTIPVCRNGTNVLSYCPSSIRYKKNISNFVVEKNKVFQLVPKKFQWKNSEKWDFGLIAEEVLKVYPELVTYNDKNEIEGVKYEKIGTLLVPIVKEHDEKIMFLEKIIEEQQKEIEELRRLIK